MLIIGTFEHSIELEQALAVLEHNGIPRKQILLIPMETAPAASFRYAENPLDIYYKSFEFGVACATLASVFGASVGFILTWGPILWGLIASFSGFAAGFGIYFLINKRLHSPKKKKLPEVAVIVQCSESESAFVEETMWNYRVLTVGQTISPS